MLRHVRRRVALGRSISLEARLLRYRGGTVVKPRLCRGGGLRCYVFYAEARAAARSSSAVFCALFRASASRETSAADTASTYMSTKPRRRAGAARFCLCSGAASASAQLFKRGLSGFEFRLFYGRPPRFGGEAALGGERDLEAARVLGTAAFYKLVDWRGFAFALQKLLKLGLGVFLHDGRGASPFVSRKRDITPRAAS